MPGPIPPEVRAAVLTDIREGKLGRNQIARKHGINGASVTTIARENNIKGAFNRSATKAATEAVVADSKARRATLAARLLDRAFQYDERAWSKYKTWERGPEGLEPVEHDLPPARDQQALMNCLAIALQRHLELENHDRPESSAVATSLLDAVAAGISAAYKRQTSDQTVVPAQ